MSVLMSVSSFALHESCPSELCPCSSIIQEPLSGLSDEHGDVPDAPARVASAGAALNSV